MPLKKKIKPKTSKGMYGNLRHGNLDRRTVSLMLEKEEGDKRKKNVSKTFQNLCISYFHYLVTICGIFLWWWLLLLLLLCAQFRAQVCSMYTTFCVLCGQFLTDCSHDKIWVTYTHHVLAAFAGPFRENVLRVLGFFFTSGKSSGQCALDYLLYEEHDKLHLFCLINCTLPQMKRLCIAVIM